MPRGPKTVSANVSLPLSCSIIIPVAVSSLETEATRMILVGAIRTPASSSAQP